MSLCVGPFVLHAPIGAGGMASVWGATHAPTGLRVAVKVMQGARARDPRFVATFNEEVRHVVALSHPAIVTVYDYGLLPEAVADAPHAGLVPASPYLVMEYAGGLSLDRAALPMAWPDLHAALVTLLDALAHAHARGVLHLDLKPANVLRIDAADDGRGIGTALRLSDFGLARAFRETPETAVLAGGTPEYMPPEQIERRWRDQGPWTDLYALGCMAWQLATGAPLFQVKGDPYATARLHLARGRPLLLDPHGMPSGFAAWVQRLIAWDPADRPPNPAAALRELTPLRDAELVLLSGRAGAHVTTTEGMADTATFTVDLADVPTMSVAVPTERALLPTASDSALAPTVARGDSVLAHGEVHHAAQATVATPFHPEVLAAAADTVSDVPLATAASTPRVLADTHTNDAGEPLARRPFSAHAPGSGSPLTEAAWSDTLGEQAPRRLVGAGLGLLPLRRFPLVGRHSERTALWRALLEANQTRHARVMLVEGALGVGRTRLVTAVAERALELGVAQMLHVTHERLPGDGDGLLAAIGRFLRVDGLDPVKQDRRLDARFGVGSDVGPLLRDTLPPGIDERDRAAWRHAALTRLLSRLAGPVPWLIVVDDAEWGEDTLAFVSDVLAGRGKPFPALVLVCSEAQSRAPALDALRARALPTVHVPPLPEEPLRELLAGYLSLDDEAAADVARRAEGNVLLAVQLVRTWADRGLLRAGPGGFVPVAGAPLDVGVRQVWGDALQRLAQEFGDATPRALRVAAAVGVEVPLADWVGALRATDDMDALLPMLPRLVEALLRAGLATSSGAGWRFAHPLVHELLEDELREDGAWASVHARLAEQFRGADPLRRARHLREAGRPDEAVDVLLEAARRSLSTHAFRDVARAVDALKRCTPFLPRDDRRVAEALLLEAPVLVATGAAQDSARVAQAASEQADAHGWRDLHARAVRYRAFALEKAGARQEADEAFATAHRLAGEIDEALDQAICLEHRGTLARLAGELATSQSMLEEALRSYRALSEPRHVADALKELGGTLIRAARPEEARTLLREARALYQTLGSAAGAAEALNNLAELAREDGRLEEAEACYREAFDAMEVVGHVASLIPLLNLAQVQLARRDYTAAEQTVTRAGTMSRASGRKAAELYACGFALPCVAHRRDWAAFDSHVERATALSTETGLRDEELAQAVRHGADLARAAGEPGRAGAASMLAARHG